MKKLIQLIIAGMMIVSVNLNAQQNTRCFVQQYKKQEGFTVITIGKPAMKMISLFAKASNDKETAQIIKRIDGIQLLVFERERDKIQDKTFIDEMLAFCDDNRYEEMIEVVKNGKTVKIFGKTEDEAITGLMIMNSSNCGDSAMVCLTGRFAIDDLQMFIDCNRKIDCNGKSITISYNK